MFAYGDLLYRDGKDEWRTVMMGHQVAQRERTELINLDEFAPQDHLLRAIDHYLDLTGLREHLKGFYSYTGRPSVDPELIIRMPIIGYCYGIRSERRLCEEVQFAHSTNYSLPSREGQVQAEHPGKDEGEESQAQER